MITITSVFTTKLIKAESINKEYDSIYCITENLEQNGKTEIYYDFKVKKEYRYPIVITQNYSDSFNIDKYNKSIDNTNKKYAGALGKVWTDNEKFISMEAYDLDIILGRISTVNRIVRKRMQQKDRQELIESILPIEGVSNHSCK